MQNHKSACKREVPRQKVVTMLNHLYDAAREQDVSLTILTSLYLKESRGDMDAIGDTDLGANYSIGPFQMRINTAKELLQKMKRDGYANLPNEFNVDELKKDYRTLARLNAYNFRKNLERGGSEDKAVLFHNAGPNTRLSTNYRYVREVNYEKSLLAKRAGVTCN